MELDDGILDHPKFIRAVKLGGSEAIHLWLGLRAYCAKLLTDGKVPGDMVDEVRGPKDPKRRAAALAALVTAGLIDISADGLEMHNYLKWSKSRAQVLAQREAARIRQGKFRSGNGGGNTGSNGVTSPVTDTVVTTSRGVERSGVGVGSPLATVGSTPPATARDVELATMAKAWIVDPNAASLNHPNPERWPETGQLSSVLAEVFGGPVQLPRNAADPRMRALLALWAEERGTAELEQAIRGAGKDDHYRQNPQFQTLTTILKDSAQVDKFIRLLTVAPTASAKASGRAHPQGDQGRTGTENVKRL